MPLPRKSATDLERPEQRTAWELRKLWSLGKNTVVSLTERCMVDRIEGPVTYVSVTGAFAVIDGWHVPCEDILAIHKPHHSQRKAA